MSISKNKQSIVLAIPKEVPYCSWSSLDPFILFDFSKPITKPIEKKIKNNIIFHSLSMLAISSC